MAPSSQTGWATLKSLLWSTRPARRSAFQLEIVEYSPGDQAPIYDLIIGKQTMHNLGVKLDFQEKTITIDEILLPMRNIANLQLEPRITRALRENTCFAQESISTHSATKRVMKLLDTKYEKADLPAIIRDNCSHLTASNREKLLSGCSNSSRSSMAHYVTGNYHLYPLN